MQNVNKEFALIAGIHFIVKYFSNLANIKLLICTTSLLQLKNVGVSVNIETFWG